MRAEALAATRLIRDLAIDADTSRTWTAPAHTAAPAACTGPGWVAVGDAARTLDPLSGQGLTAALASALLAARAVLAPDPASALEGYGARIQALHRAHIEAGRAQYLRERRFTDSPFWQRRQLAAR